MALISGNSKGGVLLGGLGDDNLFGGAGNDLITDLFGNNTFDAGAGSDTVTAGLGNDVFIHRIGENAGARDYYDGGAGQDTLRLVFTSAEWARADVQADIAAFLAYQTTCLNRLLNPLGFSTPFTFRSTNLTVVNIETLQVTVEGVVLDPRNEAVTARADALSVTEDAGGAVDLLANDAVPDRAISVSIVNGGTLGSATITPSLNGAVQTAVLSYAPSAATQALRAGQTATDTITYKVVDVNGDVGTATVTVTIAGVNDAAAITGVATGAVTEDGTAIASGKLTVSDVDTGENQAVAQTNTAGAYGQFSIDATGAWNYKLNNAAAAVQALAQNQKVTDSFTVRSLDGTASQVVTVTVTGTNDAAVIGTPTLSSVTEDVNVGNGFLIASGRISISDVDQGQAGFQQLLQNTYDGVAVRINGGPGNLGGLNLRTDGGYDYAVANSAVQYLGAGQTKTDTFTVTALDGTTRQVNFTITGTNDAAVIGDPTVSTGREDLDVNPNGFGYIDLKGKIAISDVDQGQAYFVSHSGAAGNLGNLTFQPDGSYTYSVLNSAVQYLGAGQTKTDTFTVTALDGTTKQVSFTINGTNDAASITGTATGAVIEDGISTASGKLTVSDVDTGENRAVAQGNTAGAYGQFSVDATGAWSYALTNAAANVQALAGGQTVTDSFAVKSLDGTASQAVIVTVTGTNDAASITGTASGTVTEDGTATASGKLTVSDVDTGENRAFAQTGTAGTYGQFSVDATGAWSYALNNAAANVQALTGGQTVTDTFTVKSLDGTASQAVTVTVKGTNDAASITGTASGAVTEDGTATTSGKLTVSDVDTGENQAVAQTGTAGTYGQFSVDATGAWSYALNNAAANVQALAQGQTVTDSFAVKSLDGTASQAVIVTIKGTNDAASITGTASGAVTEDGTATASGKLTVSDIDTSENQAVAQTGTAGTYGQFSVDATGAWSYGLNNAAANVQALTGGQTVTDSFAVKSLDGTASQAVIVTVTGTNDTASITGTASGAVTEDGTATTSGKLTVSDVDTGENQAVAQTGTAGTYGQFSVDATGSWSYALTNAAANVQALTGGQTVTDSFAVKSLDGTASQAVIVTVTGTNDAASITGTASGAVTEDGTATTSGKLTVSDVDTGENQAVAQTGTAGTYGQFSIDTTGAWIYALNNAATNVQALADGQTVTDAFTVQSLDGTASQTVTVTLTGANDAPVAVADAVTVSQTGTTILPLVGNDRDVDGDPLSVSAVTQPSEGSVQIQAGQAVFDPGSAFAGLSAGQTATVSLTYTVSDGHGGSDQAKAAVTVQGAGSFAPGAATQATSTTLANAQTVFLQLDTDSRTNDSTAPLTATIGLGAVLQPDINIAYVIDASNSEATLFNGASVGDVNGDGIANTRFDVQIAGLINLTNKIKAQGFDPAHTQLSIVPFDTTVQSANNANKPSQAFQLDDAGVAGAIAYLKQLRIPIINNVLTPGFIYNDGGTNYEDGLRGAIRALSTMDPDRNQSNFVYFVSDGQPNVVDVVQSTHNPVGSVTGTTNVGDGRPLADYRFADEVKTLTADDTLTATANDGFNAKISAIGIGSSTLTYLNAVDNTGGAEIATSATQFSAALLGSPLPSASVTAFSITVNGETVPGIGVGSLVDTPIGLKVNVDLGKLIPFLGETNSVIARATFTGGQTLNTALNIDGALPQSFDGPLTIVGTVNDDVRHGANGNDALTGGLGADQLTGGGGADIFVYNDIADSRPGAFDTITDFGATLDKLDLSALHAALTSGVVQQPNAGSSQIFDHAVTWFEQGGQTIVAANTTGGGSADLVVHLAGTGLGLRSDNFIV